MRWAIAIVLLAGCAPTSGVDLRLVPDPNVNLEARVLEELDRVVLIVDADEPLYLPGEERSVGDVQIENADSDPSDLELVITIPITSRLPLVRLERGGLPDVALDLRLLGLPVAAGAPATVVGRVQGVRLSAPPEELAVPFNLRPELLPPRVTEVLPGDGAMAPGCALDHLYVMFSKPVDAATLADAVRLTPGRVESVRLDPSGLTAELVVRDVVGDGENVQLEIAVDATVRDTDGRALDQVPGEPGAQGFDAALTLVCGRGMSTPEFPCEPDADPELARCPFPERLACVDGFCVPTTCDPATCADDAVCDPATGRCALDCRPWGEADVCPEERPRCDAESGVCVP